MKSRKILEFIYLQFITSTVEVRDQYSIVDGYLRSVASIGMDLLLVIVFSAQIRGNFLDLDLFG